MEIQYPQVLQLTAEFLILLRAQEVRWISSGLAGMRRGVGREGKKSYSKVWLHQRLGERYVGSTNSAFLVFLGTSVDSKGRREVHGVRSEALTHPACPALAGAAAFSPCLFLSFLPWPWDRVTQSCHLLDTRCISFVFLLLQSPTRSVHALHHCWSDVSKMKILSCTPPLGVPSGPPTVPGVPSSRLVGIAKAFSYPALPNLAGFSSIKPSCPVCAAISALNACSFHVTWSLQLIPRACWTGKPSPISLPVHNSPNLGEVAFFTPVSSHGIPKLFLSQRSSHCVIVVCFMSIPPTWVEASWGLNLRFILLALKLVHRGDQSVCVG